MSRKLPEPRYITPASVDVGDTIRVVWSVGDIEHSRTSKVAHIHERVFFAPDGQEIFRWHPTNQPHKIRVTLLSKADPRPAPTLFDDDMLGETRQRLSS